MRCKFVLSVEILTLGHLYSVANSYSDGLGGALMIADNQVKKEKLDIQQRFTYSMFSIQSVIIYGTEIVLNTADFLGGATNRDADAEQRQPANLHRALSRWIAGEDGSVCLPAK
eukprot:scaffold277344_cov21-Prasinocladus_malaysianus.AAC.1